MNQRSLFKHASVRPNGTIGGTVPARLRAIGGISVLSIAMLLGMAGAASAASVTPTPINSGNPTCGDFNPGWTELKVDSPGNGTFTDGTLTVTISNFQNPSSGTPGSFDWSSNIGVDAVLVKAGSDKHNLYVYNPESTGDADLGPQAGAGNGISHMSFCYDTNAPTPSESQPAPSESQPAPTGSVLPIETQLPSNDLAAGGVATGGTDVTPPPTDMASIDSTQQDNVWPLIVLIIATTVAIASFVMPGRLVRRSSR
jgi:hypothetical protein